MAFDEIQIAANVPQAQFLSLKTKFRAFVGGYGSGKTFVGCMAMCRHHWEFPKVDAGYFAPTYAQIRDIFYPTIEEVAFNFGLDVKIREGNKEVHFYRGARYKGTTICRSMENPASIVGFKIGYGLIDEYDVLPLPKALIAWRKIIARMRYKVAGLRNGIDVVTTPEGFLATHKIFIADVAKNPALNLNYGIIQASTHDNEANLPDDYIPSLVEAYPKELINAYLLGQFVNLRSGTVYRNFDRIRNNSTEKIKPKETLMVGMDFNIQHMAATIYGIRDSHWHGLAELSDIFDTPDMARILKERYKDKGHRIVIYPDASGASGHSSNASLSDFVVLQQFPYNFELRVDHSNPAVKDRIASVNRQFERHQLFINSRTCPKTADCLEKQTYDKNGEPDKKSGFDHQNDATGYPIAREFPIVRPVTQLNVAGMI